VTPITAEPNDPDAREQLARGLGFLRRALRSWPIVLCALFVGGLGCLVFLYLNKPRYRSETVIFYAEKGSAAEGAEPTATRAVTLRLKELLISRPTLERVIMKFDPYPELRRTQGTIEAVEELKKHIDFRAPGGDTISIAFEGSSPTQTQSVTAELARLVIDSDSELRKSQARATLEFLTGEKQATESRLREAEEELASFMAEHPRFALDATPLSNGAAIRASLGAGTAIGASAGGSVLLPAARWAGPATRAPGVAAPAPAPAQARTGNEPPNAEALARAAVAAARQNLAEQLLHYTPAHPDVRAAQADLERANQRLAGLASNAAAPAPAADPASAQAAAAPALPPPAARRKAALELAPSGPTAARLGEQTKELVELETQWLKLTRAVTEAHQRQDQVEAQLSKADIESSSERAGHGVQVSTIDPAFLPERPLPPGRTLIGLLFFVTALVLGGAGALVRAAFDDRLFGARDLASISEVLVEIPNVSRERRARAAT
jgi:uncharacterized protein involved in exopolysaccharide biosynthesis